VTRHARKVCASSMNYSAPRGRKDFREVIAAYLRTSRGVRCEASQVMVVNGSQQALDLSARVLLDPGSPVWVEEPGYEWLQHTLRLAGAKLIPVPVDGAGLNVAAGIRQRRNARAAYVTPSHQYPLGATMSAARRLQLLAWAHQNGAWIVEDDYDSEYRYESPPVASLQGLDGGARVIYIGTFSKTLFPSLRLGYLIIPEALVDRFAAVRLATDLCPAYLYQAALRDFLEEGHFARHLRKTKLIYSERRNALVRSIREEFGDRLEILGADAGMHLVVTLPKGLSDRRISSRAAAEGLWLQPLSAAYLGEARQGFILGFGGITAAEMPTHVRRLKRAISGGAV
jgi:GntR family transcriptional regulator / MocR family aminotransferase